MNESQKQVREFHKKAGHVVKNSVTKLTDKQVSIRYDFILEELNELREATNTTDQVDALVDILYFTYGTAVMMGVDLEPIFPIVHKANMDKLRNGKILTDPITGKVKKPLNWTPPEVLISGELYRQLGL